MKSTDLRASLRGFLTWTTAVVLSGILIGLAAVFLNWDVVNESNSLDKFMVHFWLTAVFGGLFSSPGLIVLIVINIFHDRRGTHNRRFFNYLVLFITITGLLSGGVCLLVMGGEGDILRCILLFFMGCLISAAIWSFTRKVKTAKQIWSGQVDVLDSHLVDSRQG